MTRARLFSLFALLCAIAITALNVMAWRHVHAMLTFVDAEERTPSPEQLSTRERINTLVSGVQIPRPENQRTPADLGLRFETIQIRSSESITLEAWMLPKPAASGIVLLFHGYADSKTTLLPNAQAFQEKGYSTLLVDFRGSGGSSGSSTTVGYREAQDVAAVFHYVRSTHPRLPIILYGQSMGAAAILRAVDQHRLRPRAIILEACFDRLLTTVSHRFHAMKLPAFPFAHTLLFWGGIQIGGSAFSHNPADYARNVVTPTLVLHGANDPRVTEAEAQNIFDNLAGPKQLIVLPDIGHESYIVRAPAAWRQSITAFLDSLPPATPPR